MTQNQFTFTALERVVAGYPAAEAIAQEAERRAASRVFLLTSGSLARNTDEVETIAGALGTRLAGRFSAMPAHSPRDAVVACAAAARSVDTDLLVTVGGGSVTDGGKAVTICLRHDVTDMDGLDRFRTRVDADGIRHLPDYAGPTVRQVAVPTTLSGGEFNARAGITDPRLRLKQSYMHPGIIPVSVILDGAITRYTPEWLFLSTGIRAVDHAVETFLSIDANDYWDSSALHALRLLGEALPRVRSNPDDTEARQKCLVGAWLSMTGVVSGCRLGASHAIGHILGGSAGVPHGHTSCVMLPVVLDWNRPVNGRRQAELSAALGRPGIPAAEVIGDLIGGLGLPRRLGDVGVRAERLPELAANCMLDDWTFSNPRPIRSPDQVQEILTRAL